MRISTCIYLRQDSFHLHTRNIVLWTECVQETSSYEWGDYEYVKTKVSVPVELACILPCCQTSKIGECNSTIYQGCKSECVFKSYSPLHTWNPFSTEARLVDFLPLWWHTNIMHSTFWSCWIVSINTIYAKVRQVDLYYEPNYIPVLSVSQENQQFIEWCDWGVRLWLKGYFVTGETTWVHAVNPNIIEDYRIIPSMCYR